MSRSLIAMIFAAVLSLPALAETTAKDVADTLKSYTVEKKNDAVAYGKKALRAADRDIKKLESEAAKASDATKAQLKEEVKNLKAARKEAASKLDDMGKASGEAWDGTKTAFADAYRDLKGGVEKAAKRPK